MSSGAPPQSDMTVLESGVETSGGLRSVLRPRSVAVIGASRAAGSIGNEIVANLIRGGFTGPVYPVNPHAGSVRSIRAYPSMSALSGEAELAVIAVPRDFVMAVARDSIAAGVNALVVITAGFREVGPDGARLERELTDLVRANGVRMVGPNCFGVVNTSREVSMNATFAPAMPPGGDVAFMSQSGALGLSVLDYASELGIGISQFVSMGNKPDVSGNDLLLYWENDESVRVILVYVEDFGNPKRFLEIARRTTRRKPVIALKSGRSRAGARAATSHTGSLAASDSAVEALLAQAGVLRAASIEELFDMAMAFGARALPRTRRTAVLTNSGGPGILVADALEPFGIELGELSESTVQRLGAMLPVEASLRNPLDMIATATPSVYRTALTALLQDDSVGSVIAIFVPPLGIQQEDVAEAIVEAAALENAKPVLAVLMGREGLPQGRRELSPAHIPAYIFPESAARALSALIRYREWLERPVEAPPVLDTDRARARAIISRAAAERRSKLSEEECLELLIAYGIPAVNSFVATSAAEAAEIVRRFHGRAVLKIVSPDVVHKSDVGGVEVGIASPEEASGAYDAIVARVRGALPAAKIDGVLVQEQARAGREVIAGLSRDRLFGALIMFGLGGIFVEALRDVVFRVAPIATLDARDMVTSIRSVGILRGIRGQPPVDFEMLEGVLLRLSQLAIDFPEVEELDINPLMAYEDAVLAVDCRVRIAIAD